MEREAEELKKKLAAQAEDRKETTRSASKRMDRRTFKKGRR
jgi:hypothetical protein